GARGKERTFEHLLRRGLQSQGAEVRVARTLLRRELRAAVVGGVGCTRPEREDGDKGGRGLRGGGNGGGRGGLVGLAAPAARGRGTKRTRARENPRGGPPGGARIMPNSESAAATRPP